MKPRSFNYHRPTSLDEALDLLASLEDCRILAGGQSLMPMLNMRLAAFEDIVDINRVEELTGVSRDGAVATIGAMVRQARLLEDPGLQARMPILAEALSNVGHLPTRNRGTIGGSIAHLDPSAELPAIAALHDAVIVVRSRSGERRIPMEAFAVDYLTSDLAADELLTAVEIPFWPPGHGYCFTEFAHRHGDFAVVGVGVLMTLREDGAIDRLSVVFGGIGSGPVRAREIEAALAGAMPGLDTWQKAAALAAELETSSDHMASARYRSRLARTLVERALITAASRAEAGTQGPTA